MKLAPFLAPRTRVVEKPNLNTIISQGKLEVWRHPVKLFMDQDRKMKLTTPF